MKILRYGLLIGVLVGMTSSVDASYLSAAKKEALTNAWHVSKVAIKTLSGQAKTFTLNGLSSAFAFYQAHKNACIVTGITLDVVLLSIGLTFKILAAKLRREQREQDDTVYFKQLAEMMKNLEEEDQPIKEKPVLV